MAVGLYASSPNEVGEYETPLGALSEDSWGCGDTAVVSMVIVGLCNGLAVGYVDSNSSLSKACV